MFFHPYLAFAGNCREAFTHYQEVFGGELVLLPYAIEPGAAPDPERADRIMHAALKSGSDLLMGGDDPSGHFDGVNRGMCASVTVPSAAEGERVFAALAEGGSVMMPFGPSFFSIGFGMCTDRFGTPWMVNTDDPDDPAPDLTG
jgi:PhnB protein